MKSHFKLRFEGQFSQTETKLILIEQIVSSCTVAQYWICGFINTDVILCYTHFQVQL